MPINRIIRICAGLGVLGVVTADIALIVAAEGTIDLLVYFGQFTVLSNLFVALVIIIDSIAPLPPSFGAVRASAVVAIVATSVLFHALLGEPGVAGPVVNTLLHDIVPVVAVLDWLLVRTWWRPRWWAPLLTLIFPVTYFCYTLVVGAMSGHYPYFFLDPVDAGGYQNMAVGLLPVFAAFIVLGGIVSFGPRGRDAASAPTPLHLRPSEFPA